MLGGRFDENPGWPEGEFENQNNHSLVTRIDFGTASFLFMGDLEEAAIEMLVSHYGDAEGGALDADVLQVGHHGSHNATTPELLDAVTPRVAVIPVGKWTFGRTGGNFTTFAFGHPRRDVVDLLVAAHGPGAARLPRPSRWRTARAGSATCASPARSTRPAGTARCALSRARRTTSRCTGNTRNEASSTLTESEVRVSENSEDRVIW